MSVEKYPYHFYQTLILRTPIFSFKDYSLRNLKKKLKSKYFRESLLVASSTFYQQLEKIDFDLSKLDEKQLLTVKKYYNRINYRPVPFGLFTATTAVKWGNEQKIVIPLQTIHLQNSFEKEFKTVEAIKESIDIKKHRYRKNPSLYKVGMELRYLATYFNEETQSLDFNISSIQAIDVVEQLLEYCKKKLSLYELIAYLTVNQVLSTEEAELLVHDLINLQVLVDDLIPNISGEPFLQRVLKQINNDDQQSVNKSFTVYNVAKSLDVELGIRKYIQNSADVYVNVSGTAIEGSLNIAYQKSVSEALNCLFKISCQVPANDSMDGFFQLFEKKFGTQMVPLLYALDPQTGISYHNLAQHTEDNILLKDVYWPADEKDRAAFPWTKVHQLLLEKWNTPIVNAGTKKQVIKLTENDLKRLDYPKDEDALPPSISVVFRVAGKKILIENVGGITATSLTGRFTPFDDNIKLHAATIAQKEVALNPGVIFAEIVHVCNLHTANINRREHLYPYEIPVLTESTLDDEHQILLSDLWLYIAGRQIILYSKNHGKRVIPRLSSAFTYSRNNLAVFQFLCDFQYQNMHTGFKLDLSQLFPNLKHYPRIEFQDTILSPETWQLDSSEFKDLIDAPQSEFFIIFKKIKKQLRFPQWIALTANDRQLVYNLNNTDEILFFFQTIKTQKEIIVKEFIYPDDDYSLCVNGEQKPLLNQFVAALYRDKNIYEAHVLPDSGSPGISRTIAPGQEWLYFKLYCHPSQVPELIGECLRRNQVVWFIRISRG
ncbi:lantibiotic dehydratase family protein [Mucilaginibacter sp. FT3.2]|uniref:lantibiotic dehydratase family protein n=1 Tax=Mucilaginibacter sp. FT3.2 TaxID=2723090 RepID=UPI00160C3B4C|nr:lantibiotic dehydratase family protein [Mucilaginibacter sp. FT3.2]MBB6234218.1 hypothetical protein [Mucilaginibacter sp. FT3.2]